MIISTLSQKYNGKVYNEADFVKKVRENADLFVKAHNISVDDIWGYLDSGKTIAEKSVGDTASNPQFSLYNESDFDAKGNVKAEVLAEIEAEKKDIISEAKANGTYLKAPNGNATNLNEEQWVMVRTKRFKDWFGDWELGAKEVEIVKGKQHNFKNFADAKAWAKNNIARTYTNQETGGKGDIRISNKSIDKFISESAIAKSESKDIHLSVLQQLPQVIKNSIIAEQHADYVKGEDGVRRKENGINENVTIHRLYGAIEIDGEMYRVKVTLKEDRTQRTGKNTYSYETTKIELLAGQNENPIGSSRYSNNSITGANLLKGVEKSYKNEKILNHSKVVDKNGEPLVVYHGTSNAGFSEFKNYNGDGIWFSSEDRASWYVRGEDSPKVFKFEPLFNSWDLVEDYAIRNGISFEKADEDEWGDDAYLIDDEIAYDFSDARDIFQNIADRYRDAGGIYSVFLNIKNPEMKDAEGEYAISFDQLERDYDADGVIIENIRDPQYDERSDFEDTNYIIFDPSQIKSATDNVGTYSNKNNDIRYQIIGEKGVEQVQNILDNAVAEPMPKPINTLEEFRKEFSKPVKTPINEVNVTENVYKKVLDKNRGEIGGAIRPTLENPTFIIKDTDGSKLFVKVFNKGGEKNYNVVAVNKQGEVESYLSSVHIKSNNNLKNKIKNGAELLQFSKRDLTYGDFTPSNSAPNNTANIQNSSETPQFQKVSSKKEDPFLSFAREYVPFAEDIASSDLDDDTMDKQVDEYIEGTEWWQSLSDEEKKPYLNEDGEIEQRKLYFTAKAELEKAENETEEEEEITEEEEELFEEEEATEEIEETEENTPEEEETEEEGFKNYKIYLKTKVSNTTETDI